MFDTCPWLLQMLERSAVDSINRPPRVPWMSGEVIRATVLAILITVKLMMIENVSLNFVSKHLLSRPG